jgi:hypothetical protein
MRVCNSGGFENGVPRAFTRRWLQNQDMQVYWFLGAGTALVTRSSKKRGSTPGGQNYRHQFSGERTTSDVSYNAVRGIPFDHGHRGGSGVSEPGVMYLRHPLRHCADLDG